jgi:hypothetical protein
MNGALYRLQLKCELKFPVQSIPSSPPNGALCGLQLNFEILVRAIPRGCDGTKDTNEDLWDMSSPAFEGSSSILAFCSGYIHSAGKLLLALG